MTDVKYRLSKPLYEDKPSSKPNTNKRYSNRNNFDTSYSLSFTRGNSNSDLRTSYNYNNSRAGINSTPRNVQT